MLFRFSHWKWSVTRKNHLTLIRPPLVKGEARRRTASLTPAAELDVRQIRYREMILLIAVFSLVLAAVATVWWLRTSYETFGGARGQIPVLAGGVQASLLATIGLILLGKQIELVNWSWWYYGFFFIFIMVVETYAIIKVGALGEKRKTNSTKSVQPSN